MLERLDWKFFLTLLVTLASVAVPIWLWQLDLSSKALTLTVRSTAELQPQGVSDLDGIQVLVDGKPVTSPFVSVLELSNSGSKPIVASDFEGSLEICVSLPSTIAKARQTSSTPPSLVPALTLSNGAVHLQPLLLNPGDVVRFALITANGKPHYTAKGRIAGVSDVTVSDSTAGRQTRRYWLGQAVATLLLSLYMASMFEFAWAGLRRRLFLPWSFARGVVSAFGGALILVMQKAPDSPSTTDLALPMAIATLIAAPYLYTNARRKSAA
jgi:hypothetical protein